MTLAQIAAIVSLLLAFNVPQPTVNTVQAILQNAPSAQVVSSSVAPTPSAQPTYFVDLKVNGKDGVGATHIVDVTGASGCSAPTVSDAHKQCPMVSVSWSASKVGFKSCALSYDGAVKDKGLLSEGTIQRQLEKDTTVRIECQTDWGAVSDSILINLTP